MFYNLDLLCRKKQGKFAIIWFAATRGIKHVTRNEVQRVNIVHICEQLLEYIMSNSQSPNKRLSLYLSAKLIHGTLLIYRQQYVQLQEQICTFIFSIRRPMYCLEDEGQDKPKKQTKRKKKDRRTTAERPEQELMQQVMQTAQQVNENLTDEIHITLREEVPGMRPQTEEVFGDEGQIDLQLGYFSGEAWTTVPPQHPAPPVDEIPADQLEKRKGLSSTLEAQSPSKRRRLETRTPHSHVYPQVNVVERGSLSPDKLLRDILTEQEQLVEATMDQDVLSPDLRLAERAFPKPAGAPAVPTAGIPAGTSAQEPREAALPPVIEELAVPAATPQERRIIRTPRARPARQINFNVETPNHWRRGNINRNYANDVLAMDNVGGSGRRRSIMSPTPTRQEDPRDILRELLADLNFDNDTDYMSMVLKDKSAMLTMDSVPNVEVTGVDDQQNRTLLAPVAQQADVSVPVVALSQPEYEAPVPEEQPLPVSPRLSKVRQSEDLSNINVSAEYRRTFPSNVQPKQSRMHTSTPLTFDTESRRHGLLLTLIRELFRKNCSTPLTIEQICFPLNRYKMATTFLALLSLEAKQYVVLQSVPESTELDIIKPGLRLWDL